MITVLVVGLPAWVGGSTLATAPAAGELDRLRAALESGPREAPVSAVVRAYAVATLPATAEPARAAELLPRARLSSVLGLLAISGLLYLTVSMARRRLTALFACLALAATGPVFELGAVLRPEVPAALFGGLGVLLVVGFPAVVPRPPARRGWLRCLWTTVTAGASIGLAMACVPHAGLYLLVPGFAALLSAGIAFRSGWRAARRGKWLRYPVRALPRRVLPWMLLALGCLALAPIVVLGAVRGDPTALLPSPAPAPLLPGGVLSIVLVVLAAIGGLRLAIGVGFRLGRAHRVSTAALLLCYVACMLLHWRIAGGQRDALCAAPALAVLVGEGVASVVGQLLAWRYRPRR